MNLQDPLAEKRTILAVERNNMAAERTLLSWIRTGLAGLGGGVAMIRVIVFESSTQQLISHLIGWLLLLWGIAVFILAITEYEETIAQLKRIHPEMSVSMGRKKGVVLMLLLLSLMLLFLLLI